MPDRLAELRRQRALVQEHLAWLDREIAAVESAAPSELRSEAQIPSATARATTSFPPRPVAAATVAEPLLDDYRVEPSAVRQDVRKGCFLYFAAALVVLVLLVTLLYFTISSR